MVRPELDVLRLRGVPPLDPARLALAVVGDVLHLQAESNFNALGLGGPAAGHSVAVAAAGDLTERDGVDVVVDTDEVVDVPHVLRGVGDQPDVPAPALGERLLQELHRCSDAKGPDGRKEIPALPPPPTTRSRRFTRDITARARSSDDIGIAAVAPRMVG